MPLCDSIPWLQTWTTALFIITANSKRNIHRRNSLYFCSTQLLIQCKIYLTWLHMVPKQRIYNHNSRYELKFAQGNCTRCQTFQSINTTNCHKKKTECPSAIYKQLCQIFQPVKRLPTAIRINECPSAVYKQRCAETIRNGGCGAPVSYIRIERRHPINFFKIN